MNTEFLRVLLDPGRFFEERTGIEPGLKMPALIVLIYGMIGAIAAALTTKMLIGILPAEAQTFAMLGIPIAAVGALVVGFLTWVISAAILYIISIPLKGEGTFKRTLEFVGYSFLPQIFGGIIGVVFTYQIISDLSIPAVVNPDQLAEISMNLAEMIAADPLTPIAGVVGVMFTLWSANILIFGMKHARNLSTRNAIIAVGIPVALYIAYIFLTTFAG